MVLLRARTVVWRFFIISWLALMLAGLGAATQRWPALHQVAGSWPRPVAATLWAGLLLAFLTDHNVRVTPPLAGMSSDSAVLAYRDWLSGAATPIHDRKQRLH